MVGVFLPNSRSLDEEFLILSDQIEQALSRVAADRHILIRVRAWQKCLTEVASNPVFLKLRNVHCGLLLYCLACRDWTWEPCCRMPKESGPLPSLPPHIVCMVKQRIEKAAPALFVKKGLPNDGWDLLLVGNKKGVEGAEVRGSQLGEKDGWDLMLSGAKAGGARSRSRSSSSGGRAERAWSPEKPWIAPPGKTVEPSREKVRTARTPRGDVDMSSGSGPAGEQQMSKSSKSTSRDTNMWGSPPKHVGFESGPSPARERPSTSPTLTRTRHRHIEQTFLDTLIKQDRERVRRERANSTSRSRPDTPRGVPRGATSGQTIVPPALARPTEVDPVLGAGGTMTTPAAVSRSNSRGRGGGSRKQESPQEYLPAQRSALREGMLADVEAPGYPERDKKSIPPEQLNSQGRTRASGNCSGSDFFDSGPLIFPRGWRMGGVVLCDV